MDHKHHTTPLVTHPTFRDYSPLAAIITGIIIATVITCYYVGFTPDHMLGYSMGYFFIVFGLFKLIDLKNFAVGYAEYDLITQRIPAWAFIYPFIELSLGGLYLMGATDEQTLLTTISLSLLTVISVGIKLHKREVIHCVCLGNLLRVPLTYVSLVEYALMGLMAVAMFFV